MMAGVTNVILQTLMRWTLNS